MHLFLEQSFFRFLEIVDTDSTIPCGTGAGSASLTLGPYQSGKFARRCFSWVEVVSAWPGFARLIISQVGQLVIMIVP